MFDDWERTLHPVSIETLRAGQICSYCGQKNHYENTFWYHNIHSGHSQILSCSCAGCKIKSGNEARYSSL